MEERRKRRSTLSFFVKKQDSLPVIPLEERRKSLTLRSNITHSLNSLDIDSELNNAEKNIDSVSTTPLLNALSDQEEEDVPNHTIRKKRTLSSTIADIFKKNKHAPTLNEKTIQTDVKPQTRKRVDSEEVAFLLFQLFILGWFVMLFVLLVTMLLLRLREGLHLNQYWRLVILFNLNSQPKAAPQVRNCTASQYQYYWGRLRINPSHVPRNANVRLNTRRSFTTDTSVQKVVSDFSPKGKMGQVYLASGKNLSMRLWRDEEPSDAGSLVTRDYETVGYVISGHAEVHFADKQVVSLKAGDSWSVPKGAPHTYKIIDKFTAVEATHPPAQVKNRDEPKE
ncbi:cupin [Planoprotostelium fungivorum]|uniref:Cupin n=1 Tax=Planoprotostelium fungivorum TaxID=1890364 RepID=A0A2P6NIM8_9EUKA|nr:cupin [Planoprotostelium fungivorum]